jgi:hypothetical protein
MSTEISATCEMEEHSPLFHRIKVSQAGPRVRVDITYPSDRTYWLTLSPEEAARIAGGLSAIAVEAARSSHHGL